MDIVSYDCKFKDKNLENETFQFKKGIMGPPKPLKVFKKGF